MGLIVAFIVVPVAIALGWSIAYRLGNTAGYYEGFVDGNQVSSRHIISLDSNAPMQDGYDLYIAGQPPGWLRAKEARR